MKQRILIVDDEEDICEIIQFNLEIEGYIVDIAYSAEDALSKNIRDYDLLILDVMMGGMSGFKMAHKLKQENLTADIPIIFCSAKDSEEEKITGLNIGADDSISKPFSVRELSARVKSVLRRTSNNETRAGTLKTISSATREHLSFQTLTIDLSLKVCKVDNIEIQLTKKEFELLSLFFKYPSRIFSREDLLRHVWSNDVIVLDRTIDVNIARLRKKIGTYGKYITTRAGFGYGFVIGQ